EKALPIVERVRIPMIDAGEHEAIGKFMTDLSARMPGRIEPLEWLGDTYSRTSDSVRLPDVLAALGDGLFAAKEIGPAETVFEPLVDRERESASAKRSLNDCLRNMGLWAPEEGAPPQEDHSPAVLPEAPTPKIRPSAEPAASVTAAPKTPSVAAEPALDEET